MGPCDKVRSSEAQGAKQENGMRASNLFSREEILILQVVLVEFLRQRRRPFLTCNDDSMVPTARNRLDAAFKVPIGHLFFFTQNWR